jgi:hypothetical protein
MVNVFIGFGLLLIILIAAAFLAYYFFPATFPVFWRQANVPNQGVIKRDWVATGRIDFATSITKVTSNPEDYDQPAEFKLLVEESPHSNLANNLFARPATIGVQSSPSVLAWWSCDQAHGLR